MNTINATRTSATKFNTKYMVELALMVAVILVMSLTPLGYIRTPGLSITLLTVPVAVGAIILGPVGGLICGLTFGLTSFYQCFVGGAMGTVLLGINPFGTFVTTVVTRTLEGFLTGLIFKGLHSINGVKKFSYYIASLCCPLLNTLLFMSSLVLFFYNTDYVQAFVTALGAIIIGIVSGLLVVFGVWFLDYVLRVDDPVGAVAVHCLNGIWGTIAVGLFATTSAPGNDDLIGLFYGGGLTLLGKQLIGFAAVASWTVVTITITFLVIRAVVGLRVTEEEEIVGLDAMEHGLASAYSGFSIMDVSNTMMMDVNENTNLGTDDYKAASDAQKNAAVKVVKAPAAADTGMYKVVIISKLSRYDKLRKAMNDLGVTGMTVTQVMGCGVQKGAGEKYRGVEIDATLLPKVKVEVVVSSIPVDQVIEAAKKVLYTGHIGDGKIFVYNVDRVVKVRTGEEDTDALQDVE